MRRRRGISVQKGGKFEHTYNQQSFSLSKKLSLGQKQFFDEWVMFELCILNAHGALLIALNFHSNNYFDSLLIEKNMSG